MELSRQQIFTWAPSDILEAGSAFQKKGAVQGVQVQGDILAGSIRLGASRLVVRLKVGGERPRVHCSCRVAEEGKVCAHAIAVALQWVQQHGSPDPSEMTFAAERAPTREEILRWAGEALFAKADGLVKRGKVHSLAFNYPTGKGIVENTQGGALLATFTMLPNGMVSGKCDCSLSRERGLLCEHIMAVALGVMHAYGNPEKRAQAARERAHAQRLAGAKGLIQRHPGGLPAKLRVFLPTDFAERFVQGQVPVGVRLFVGPRGIRPKEAGEQPYALSPGDETLLGMLEDIAGGAFDDVLALSRSDTLALLRCARQSWVGFATTRQHLTFGDALETPLMVRARPEADALELSLQFPEGALLVEGRQGFWVNGTQVRPLRAVLPLPFHALYQAPITLARQEMMTFFRKELPALLETLPLAEGSLTADLFTVTPGEPRFTLEVQGSEASISAKLRAQYGSEWVYCGVPKELTLPDPDDFYHGFVRNPPRECAALDRAHAMGFMGSRGDDLGNIADDIYNPHKVLNFLGEHLTAARREGWHVKLSGAISDLLDRSEVIVPVVHVEDRPGGGAEISTHYEAPEGTLEVTPAEVEQAIVKGRAYIEKNGRVALLDIGAIKTIRDTLASCQARAGRVPGSSAIEAIHAPFLHAVLDRLEGIDFETSPNWRARAEQQNRTRAPEPVDLGRLEGTLRPYQKEGVYWLRFLEACGFCGILADEMGLGKTLQTLTWLQLPRCREDARKVPALIICPTSLVENWHREAGVFVPWLRCLVVSGPNRAALFAKVPDSDLVITSYALIRRDIEFYSACRFSAVVLDEAQAIKNARTQNAIAVKQLVADTRLVLSGTPIENGVADLWSIMDFLMPRYLGPAEDFEATYEAPIEVGGQEAVMAQARLREKLHPFLLRREKRDVAKDLPAKIRSVRYCALSDDQRKVYDTVRTDIREKMRGLVKAKGFAKSKFEVLALLMKLRQICCDLRLLKDRQPKPDEEPSAKLEALMELLEEARAGNHRMLVFSQFTSMLQRIGERLDAEAIPFCYLDGATKDRLGECAKFNQTPSIPVFLISLKAGGTGLNLTGADTVVHFDPWWNPAAEEQATDRAHRIGQKKTVNVFKLIAEDTIEEKVLELQKKKQALIEATVNASDEALVQNLTMAEIESLLS